MDSYIKNSKKRYVAYVIITLLFILAMYIVSSANVCIGDNVNIRKEPTVNSEIIGKLNRDEDIKIITIDGNWIKIERNGIIGYVVNDYIEPTVNATVSGNNVNVRKEPSANAEVEMKVFDGHRVSLIGYDKDFYTIRKDGQKLYIHNSLLKLDMPSVLAKNNVEPEPVVKELVTNATIIGDQINVRVAPSASSEKVTQFNNGERISAAIIDGDWIGFVRNDQKLWIARKFVKIDNGVTVPNSADVIVKTDENTAVIKDEAVPEAAVKYIYVIAETGLNLRKNATVSSNKITTLMYRTKLEVLEELPGWVKVKTPSGQQGYASCEFLSYDVKDLKDIPNEELRMEIVNYAKKFIGTRYVYGGNSLTNGIDCSGFTGQVFKRFGYNLSRVSKDQINDSVPISKSELLPGDLVFFATMGGNTISHVALYIGNGEIVHATSATSKLGVEISDLNSAYYLRTYRCAGRVIR